MSSRTRSRTVVTAVALAAASVACLSGCAGNSVDGLRLSPTPELLALAHTPDEAVNNLAINNDMNMRMITDDLARAFLLQRPSRLSYAPVPR